MNEVFQCAHTVQHAVPRMLFHLLYLTTNILTDTMQAIDRPLQRFWLV